MAKPILVRSAKGRHPDTSTGFTAILDCTGANMLVVRVMHGGSASIGHPDPTVSGTALAMLSFTDEYNAHTRLWYLPSPPQGEVSLSYPAHSGSGFKHWTLEALSGVDLADPFGPIAKAPAAGSQANFPLTLDNVAANELILSSAYSGHNASKSWSADSATVIHQSATDAYAFAAATNSSEGNVTIPWVVTDPATINCHAVAFTVKGVAAPAGPTLSGKLKRRNGAPVIDTSGLIITVSTAQGGASIIPASTISTNAAGDWTFTNPDALAYATQYWVTIAKADGSETFTGKLSTQADPGV